MKTIILLVITATCMCTLAHKIMNVDPTIIPGSNAYICPSVEQREESFQLIRDNIMTAIISSIYTGQCGDGSWSRVAYLNMSDPLQQCPTNWREVNNGGVRACGRSTNASCPVTVYSTGSQYSEVCGRVIGYQEGSADAFNRFISPLPTIDGPYVDGISVTYGSPRMHIWTFAAGLTEGAHGISDCPCVEPSGQSAPDFIDNNYYCESGNQDPMGNFIYGNLYSNDPLWDGEQCEGQCCSNGKSPPWFTVELPNPTNDDIEVRICLDQNLSDEDTPVALIELYVK